MLNTRYIRQGEITSAESADHRPIHVKHGQAIKQLELQQAVIYGATLILSEIENVPKGTADAYRTNRNEQEEFRYLGYDGGRLVGGAVSSPPMSTLHSQRIP